MAIAFLLTDLIECQLFCTNLNYYNIYQHIIFSTFNLSAQSQLANHWYNYLHYLLLT